MLIKKIIKTQMKKLLFLFLISFSLFKNSWADELRDKVEDLFIKASSGMEMYRDLVEPSQQELIKMGKEAVPYLVEKLKAQDAREINSLIDILSKIGEPAVLPLIDCLKSDNKDKVKTAVRILGNIKDQRAVSPLANLLHHSDYSVRGNACTSLGQIKDNSVTLNLAEALLDTVELVRKSAAYGLGEIKDKRGIPALINSLGDKYYGVRYNASEALVNIGASSVEPLLKILNSKERIKKYHAIEALGKIGDKKAIIHLIKLLQDEDWATRGFTVEALSSLDYTVALMQIQKLKKTETHPFVKRKIEEILEAKKNEKKT